MRQNYFILKVRGTAPALRGWLRHLFDSETILSQICPKIEHVPEDGATLHVPKAMQRAIYPI